MRTLLGLMTLLLLSSAGPSAFAQPKSRPSVLQSCLHQARWKASPGQRDEARKRCLERFSQKLSVPQCIQLTAQFEYSIYSEDAKEFCLFRKASDLSVPNCLKVANALVYGENKDELLWTCLRERASNLSRKNCLVLAKNMVFPASRDRATSYCQSEL